MMDIVLPENALIKKSELSSVKVKYIGFDRAEHDGVIVCASTLADEVKSIFDELFGSGYRIENVQTSDVFGGDDDKLMANNITSCFNYRCVANSDTISLHALGRAIDINPLYNPYIQNGVIMPANAEKYADRTKAFEHKIDHDDECFKIFSKHGWLWGGDWDKDKDYQHFYKPFSLNERIKMKFRKMTSL